MDVKLKVGVLIENDDSSKVLLIKEKLPKNNRALWNIVKGSYEKDDLSILNTAKRECLEEVGVEIRLRNILAVYFSQKESKLRIQPTFIATIESGKPKLSPKNKQLQLKENISSFSWFDKQQLSLLKPNAFVNKRAWQVVHDWANNKRFPLDSYREIEM